MSVRRKLVMVADWGSGMSSVAIRMALNVFPDQYRPNVYETFVADGEVDGKHVELALWEVVDLEDYQRLRPLNYMNSHVVLLGFAIDNTASLENVSNKWISEVREYCPYAPVILLGCKMDLRGNLTDAVKELEAQKQHLVMPEEGQAVAEKIGAKHYLECSAKTGEGVQEVFQCAARLSLSTPEKKMGKCVKCIIV